MKTIKSILVMAIMVVTSFTSCKKQDLNELAPNGVSVQTGNGGISIQLYWGNGGYGYYWGWGNIPANVNTSVAYVISPPLGSANIAVYDQKSNQMGSVDFGPMQWQTANNFLLFLQKWDYAHRGPCPVLVKWNTRYTSAPWDGNIIG